MCVCVCQTLYLRALFHLLTFKAGGPGISLLTWSNKARQRDGKHWETSRCVPAEFYASCDHTFPRFDSWWFTWSLPQTFPLPLFFARALLLHHCRWEKLQCSNTFDWSDSSPCRYVTPFLLGIALTENQCQSVNRSAVLLGCWVWSPSLGRWSHAGISQTDFSVSTFRWILLTDSFSPLDQLH